MNTIGFSRFGDWLHLTIAADTQNMTVRIYHDGERKGNPHPPKENYTETKDAGPGRLVFGRSRVDKNEKYGQATFDEFASWNGVLSESEIKTFCKC